MEPYNDKIQVLTKQTLKPSKSMGNLDQSIKAPNEVCALDFLSYLLLILPTVIQALTLTLSFQDAEGFIQ